MLKPRLIVADEPVSMVDASLRAMILDIMLRLRDQHHISFLYITHDLSTAYQIGDRIYLALPRAIAERGHTSDVIEKPKHPYVQLLIDSIPVPDPNVKWGGEEVTTLDDEQMRVKRQERLPLLRPLPLIAWTAAWRPRRRCIRWMGRGHEAACYLYDEAGERVAVTA